MLLYLAVDHFGAQAVRGDSEAQHAARRGSASNIVTA